jgi:hypothetical protein
MEAAMSVFHRRGLKAALAAMALAAGAGVALAAPGSLDLGWDSLGPGGPASGGSYALESVVPHEAGAMSGGAYTLAGGYLGDGSGTAEYPYALYLPLLTR